MPNFQSNRLIGINLLLDHYEFPRANFFHELLIDVLLNHPLPQLIAERAQGLG